ncbi:hypothetical protein WSM22_12960 [Cytophagales bacterium WSM2-2]|nr:hypothetical protein WSM22_12960 [Cytophagales bacterium WSM2-2]
MEEMAETGKKVPVLYKISQLSLSKILPLENPSDENLGILNNLTMKKCQLLGFVNPFGIFFVNTKPRYNKTD